MTNTPSIDLDVEKNQRQAEYIIRSIAYLVAAIVLGAGVHLEILKQGYFHGALACLIFPHALQMVAKRLPERMQAAGRLLTLHLDALLCGLLIASLGTDIQVASIFLLMLVSATVLMGRPIAWLSVMLALAAGHTAGQYWFALSLFTDLPIQLFEISVGGCAIFFVVIGHMYLNQAHKLKEQAGQLKAVDEKLQQEFEKQKQLSEQVSKYLAPQVKESILQGQREAKLETQRKKLVVFFSDIVGFSSLSDGMEADALTEVLNGYLTDMSEIALKYGGTIDKFIGDGIMIFFGDPKSKGAKKDALACVAMAIEMRRHMLKLRSRWSELGMTAPLQIRMGISTGYCTVGNFGTSQRMDYTILGREVNLASRLESEADAGQILISQDTYALVRDKIMCRQRGQAMVKGFRDPVPLYQVVDFRRDLGSNPGFMNHETDGFSIYLESDLIRESEKGTVADALEKAAARLRGQQSSQSARKSASTQGAVSKSVSSAKTIR